MSSELERRLEGLLLEAPEPDSSVEERALERALGALAPRRRRERRHLRIALVLVAAALALLALAAGSLAAAGALHVSIGRTKSHTKTYTNTYVATPLTLPPGAAGITAVINGRLSVVTRSGFRLQGLPVSAATLSPHALYVAAGIHKSLVAMAPDGSRRAWSHPTGGTVVAIAWAPDGLRIAYVMRGARRLVLHTIWANGTHDEVIDRSVRSMTPSWRADSLAFTYVGAGGKEILYDLAHQRHRVVAGSPSLERAHLPVRLQGRVLSIEKTGKTFAAVLAGPDRRTRVVAGTRQRFATVLSLPPRVHVESVVVR